MALPSTKNTLDQLFTDLIEQGTATEGKGSVLMNSSLLASFVTKINNIFNIKNCQSELVSMRRSTVLSLPLQLGIPGWSQAQMQIP